VLTRGKHPFGSCVERELHIGQGKFCLDGISHMPEALDLVASMIHSDPAKRLTAEEVCAHPFFWSDERKLAFLQDVSDRVECEPATGILRMKMEAYSDRVVGLNWDTKLDQSLLDNLGKYRKYDYSSVRDCLRVIRNKKHHYRDFPTEVQQLLGSLPSGFLRYFTSRFPRLLLHTYAVMAGFCTINFVPPTPASSAAGTSSASSTTPNLADVKHKHSASSPSVTLPSPPSDSKQTPCTVPSFASPSSKTGSSITAGSSSSINHKTNGTTPVTFREYYDRLSERQRQHLFSRVDVDWRGWWPRAIGSIVCS